MKQYDDNSQIIGYTYNDSSIRTKKTVKNKSTGKTVTRDYYLDDTNILAEKVNGSGNGDRTVWYAYSGDGTLTGFTYNDADYYYQKNLQGDIIGIYNASGKLVVTYEYDAWGNLTNMTDTSGKNLGEINPFRYRSYYYDEDTGWYYLQSRYYDAEIGRFLNADDVEYLGGETLDCNLFTYCNNNFVNGSDPFGNFYITIKKLAKIVLACVAINPIASVLMYVGYKYFKARVNRAIARIALRIAWVAPAFKIVVFFMTAALGFSLAAPLVSALWDAAWSGKKGLVFTWKRNRRGIPYQFTIYAK